MRLLRTTALLVAIIVVAGLLIRTSQAEASIVDFKVPILDLDNKPAKDISPDGKPGPTLTIGIVAERALLSQYPDEPQLAAEQKAARWKLALKIHGADKADLQAEDIALIKTLVGKAYGPLIVGRVFAAIDPEKK